MDGDSELYVMSRLSELVTKMESETGYSLYDNLNEMRILAMRNPYSNKHLCHSGAIKLLTQFLKVPNERILSLTLSILANSCLHEEPRKSVVENQAIPHLASILKHLVNESIYNRACRLVANLAQTKSYALELHKQKVMEVIVNILNTSASAGTHQSAIRALRVLWESVLPEHTLSIRENMLTCGAMKAVAEKLKSSDKEVVRAALKAISVFTEYAFMACASHLDSSGYEAVVSKLPDPSACQIVYYLSRGPGALSLNNSHTVKAIINILSSPKSSSSRTLLPAVPPPPPLPSQSSSTSEKEKEKEMILIYSLCMLCNECTGRMQLLTAENGLSVFLKLLEETRNQNIKMKLYSVLLHFTPEPQTLLCLTRAGLVRVLVNKLDNFVTCHGTPHESVEKWTEGEESWSMCSQFIQGSSLAYKTTHKASGLSPDYSLGSNSPSSELCSPGSSVHDSPLIAYSPVCSSAGSRSDTEDNSLSVECEENDLVMPNTNLVDIDFGLESMKEDMTIVYILDKLLHVDGMVDDLASNKTVRTLIKYKSQVRNSDMRVINFFRTLVSKQQYYCQLLDNHFALEVHRALCRPIHSKCGHCEKVRLLGDMILEKSCVLSESGLGEGQMAHRLLTGTDDVKFQVAITVPLVSRDVGLLARLLFKYKAYDMLREPLEKNDATTGTLEDIMFGLRELFRTLNYKNPQKKTSQCPGCDIGKLRKESSVLFSLDDGSIVSANKTTLCNISPVFEAMFRGGFKESEEAHVKISDVSAECLINFVRLLDTYCECILPNEVATLLELVSVSDRFLVGNLAEKVLAYIMNFLLSYKNCQVIYKWATECKLPLAESIGSDVIKYIFTSNMTNRQLKKAVTSMLNGIYKDRFLEDMSAMIKDTLITHKRRKYK